MGRFRVWWYSWIDRTASGASRRASIAASFLQRNGYEDVSNVVGGMSAWKAAKLPTV